MIPQNYLMAIVSILALYLLFVIVWAIIFNILGSLVGSAFTFVVTLLGLLGSIILEIVRNLDDAQYLEFRPFFIMLSATFLIAGIVVFQMIKKERDGIPVPTNKSVIAGCQISFLIIFVFWIKVFEGLSLSIQTQLYWVIGRLVLGEMIILALLTVVMLVSSRKKA